MNIQQTNLLMQAYKCAKGHSATQLNPWNHIYMRYFTAYLMYFALVVKIILYINSSNNGLCKLIVRSSYQSFISIKGKPGNVKG